MTTSLPVYVMALAWVLGCCAIAVAIAAAVLHVCWLVEDRARQRRRKSVGDVDLSGRL